MKFTESHEWVSLEGNIAIIGVTEHAQQELGDIVYVELPKVGKMVRAGEEAAVLESTKAAADVYSPISGTIHEVNNTLKTDSHLINASPEKDGWIFKVQITEMEELENLMDKEAYEAMLKGK